MLAAIVNFALVAVYMRMLRGRSFSMNIASTWRPLVNSQLVHALGTAASRTPTSASARPSSSSRARSPVTFSRLLRDLMEAERLRDEATERNEELAATNERLRRAHFGAMRSLVRSIHLHDRPDRAPFGRRRALRARDRERHRVHGGRSATRPHRRPAPRHRQAHLRRPILIADTRLTDEEWEIVKQHPEEGARVVGESRARGRSPRSSAATTSGSTASGYPAGSVGMTSRGCRA